MRTLSTMLGLGVMILAGIGCSASGVGSSGTPEAEVQDAATNYAQAIRASALSVRDGLREEGGLETAKGNTEALLEALEGYESNPDADPHKATYDELAKTANDLKGLFDAKGPPDRIRELIEQLAATAEKLPGTAEAPPTTNVGQ